jgi:hypothetical protein
MSGSIFKRTAHLRAFVTDDEPAPRHRVRSKIRMPRTVVTAPAAGPARETPATRRRRTASAATASATTESTGVPEAAPRRRRAAAKPAATAPAETPTDSTEDTAPASAIDEPATDTGEGDKQ